MHTPAQHSHTLRRYLGPMLAGVAVLLMLLVWSLGRSPHTGDPAAAEAVASMRGSP